MNFKVGDKVIVIDGRNYGFTKTGSHGKVIKIEQNGSVLVKFDYMSGNLRDNVKNSWYI